MPLLLRGLCLLLVAFAVAACSGSGPADTVERFHRNLADGDVEAAADLLGGPMMEMIPREKLLAGLAEQSRTIIEKGGVASYDVLSEEVSEQMASVRMRVNYADGTSEEEATQLMKIDGDWKITPDKG